MNYELVTGVAATIAAVAAVSVAVWQSVLTRHHNRLAVMPRLNLFVNFTDAHPEIGIALVNNGLGPAFVRSCGVFVDASRIGDACPAVWRNTTRLLGLGTGWVAHAGFFAGDAIAPGQRVPVIFVAPGDQTPDRADLLGQALTRIRIRMEYESAYRDLGVVEWDGSTMSDRGSSLTPGSLPPDPIGGRSIAVALHSWLRDNAINLLISIVATYGAVLASFTQFCAGPTGALLRFQLMEQRRDNSLELYVSNTGDRHAVVDRIEICGIGEFFLLDTEFQDQHWIDSSKPESEGDIFALLHPASSRWLAQCFTKVRLPRLIEGDRSIQPDSAQRLLFAPVEDLEIRSTAPTGTAIGMGQCTINLWAGRLHVSRVFICRTR